MVDLDTTSTPLCWQAYLQLLRLPNVFTAVAEVSMGYLLVSAGRVEMRLFLPLLVCSVALYLAGMVLNDVCDFEQDLRERPLRPLPAGRIARRSAAILGGQLLFVGLVAGWVASWIGHQGRSGAVATLLASAVLAYDLGGKRTWLGPPLMGTCRFLNVLLGMSAVRDPTVPFSWSAGGLAIAAALGLYVAGITWFARSEARISYRRDLLGGASAMVLGILLLAFPPARWGANWVRQGPLTHAAVWPGLLLLLTLPVWRRVLVAIQHPEPGFVQVAVKQAILTLILLDAAICLAGVGPRAALAVLSLLIPFLILGRCVAST